MADLATQLRDYLEATAPAVSLSEVESLRAVRPSPAPLAARGRLAGAASAFAAKVKQVVSGGTEMRGNRATRGWLIAAAAMAVALVIALPLWFVFRGEETPPATTVPVTTTTVPSTTTAPATTTTAPPSTTTTEETTTTVAAAVLPPASVITATPASLIMTWESASAAFGEQAPVAVAAGGTGMAAVSSWGSVWTSGDGRDWSPHPDEVLVLGAVADVAAWSGGFVAVGEANGHAGVWLSPDGVTWTAVPDQEAFTGDVVRMVAVTAGGPGLVAVGQYDPNGFDSHAAVWLSADGLAWIRVDESSIEGAGAAVPDEVGGSVELGQAIMSDVTAGGPGLIAVGTVDPYWWYPAAAVWVSEDGTSWDQIVLDERAAGQEGYSQAYRVAANAAGIAVVGQVGDRRGESVTADIAGALHGYAAVWMSENGTDWHLAGVLDTDPDSSSCRYQEGASGVLWSGSSLLVTGWATTTCQTRDEYRMVWATPDLGGAWHEIARLSGNPLFTGQGPEMSSVAPFGPRIVAAGAGAVWLGTFDAG
jgi:hypothetical protein